MEKSGSDSPEMLVSMDPKTEQVFAMQMDNRLPLNNMGELMLLAKDGCKLIYQTLKAAVRDYSFTLRPA